MIKKFTIIVLMMLLFNATLFSQGATATLSSVSTSPGQTFSVPLMVTNFNNISGITFTIKFDPSVLTPMFNSQGKLNLTNLPTGYNLTHFLGYISGGNKLVIIYTDPNMLTISNGKLFDINFTSFCGSSSTNLEFLGGSEIVQGIPPVVLPITFTNSTISTNTTNSLVQIGNVIYDQLQPSVSVPVSFSGFSTNIGSIEQYIQYDQSKLTFINATGTGAFANGLLIYANNGVISVSYSNASGNANINSSVINLNFISIATNTANLNFYGCCLISNVTGSNYIDVNYLNGSVVPATPVSFASLSSISNAIQGQDYEIPLILSSFLSGNNGIAAYTLNINFDNSKLSYIGVSNNIYSNIVNQSGNNLNIVWSNINAPNINGQVLKLKFKYNGIGVANISFKAGTSFSNVNGNSINVGYTDATISPISTNNFATIGSVNGVIGSNVLVPVSFTGLPSNAGAVTLYIDYDQSKLTYIDVQNNIHNATAFLDPLTQKIKIVWSNASGLDLNGTFLNLKFAYLGGGSNSAANVAFSNGCEITDNSTSIICCNWIDGGVNLKFKISGILNYDNDPIQRISLAGFKIYLYSSIGNTLIDSCITDSTGYYQLMAGNGTYIIHPTSPIGAYWYSDFDDVIAIYQYIVDGTSLPYENPLRLLACDVSLDGDINFDDVEALYERIADGYSSLFTAPDFVFETPNISVNSSDIINQDILGICSGNVYGSNTSPNPY